MYKKYSLFLITISMLFFSCMKKASTCAYEDQNVAATTAEIAYLQNYITTSSITNVTQHPCGVFYTVENAGSGETLNLCNTITVKYGAFVLGAASPFDSFTDSSGIPFILGRLITGIQKTLPTIRSGGQITMYIPPSLAYGSAQQQDQNGSIILPSNSYLKFEMTILAVQ
ncbi:MAG: FKBP-type peptidyl-prolyl cis-trans isomerase [Bacteroidota bacterium]